MALKSLFLLGGKQVITELFPKGLFGGRNEGSPGRERTYLRSVCKRVCLLRQPDSLSSDPRSQHEKLGTGLAPGIPAMPALQQ